ncbi:hypothetical protein [Aeromonas veronii]|uniref:hypothetical protein n=1 Tax=Aeromonas veronii TaxID=654 RepID=UPI0025429855|nr:hypothetical protein [Aeromonas veronii]WIJ41349.1 hypothetical protein QPK06_20260 [Aeromonas veronii]
MTGIMQNRYLDLCASIFHQVEIETRDAADDEGLDFSSLSLRLIDLDALNAQAQWPAEVVRDRQVGWSWSDALRQYRQNHMARIELAIWNGDELCGLMLGKASHGRLVVKVNYLQGSTSPEHALKGWIAAISTRCAELFAGAIGAEWVAIQEPLAGLIDHYGDLGFTNADPFDPRSSALFKRLAVDIDLM